MNIIVLNSGSNGNAVYVESRSGSAVLLDCGISARQVETRLKEHRRSAAALGGIFITHEHTDHVRGIGTLAFKYRHSVYLTPGTRQVVRRRYPGLLYRAMEPGADHVIGDMTVRAHRKSHDAVEPVFFEVRSDNRTFLYITDLGVADARVRGLVAEADALLLESNHDVDMLRRGPYPEYLKERILSDVGHLSNRQCMDVLSESGHGRIQHLVLGHLSKHNNTHAIVETELSETLRASALSPLVTIASRDVCSGVLHIE